jgi:mono/diheme cytochrome c family protein
VHGVRPQVASWLAVAGLLVASAADAAGDSVRGREIFALAGGCGCHTADAGPVGAGGREIPTPFGTFYGTNLTADRETGLGEWSDDEIVAAIRQGDRRDGAVLAPVMPYYRYAAMSDEDVRDLVAYLRTLPAMRRDVPAPRARFGGIDWLPLPRVAYRAWRLLYGPSIEAPTRAPSEEIARGRYLVEHVAICADCHTPRNRLGAPDASLELAGVDAGADSDPVPNITTDVETGIGDWEEADIAQLLRTGRMPDFDNVQGEMAEVIDGRAGGAGYKDVPEADLRAIARYLKTVPPVSHAVEDKDDDE